MQKQNLPQNLSKKIIREEGFLTVEHDFNLLWKMNAAFPHTLATENGKVIGHTLSMHPQFGNEIELFRSMFKKTKTLVPSNSKYLVMGQICVAKTHRGLGIFRRLYKNMQRFTNDSFDIIITEVDIKNTRSMNAHKSVGIEELSRTQADERTWCIIQLK